MKKSIINLSVLAVISLCITCVFGQVNVGSKLEKYYSALLNRPESQSLFQRFQTCWLAEGSEDSLDKFLKGKSLKGGVADKQLYATFLLQKGKELEAVEILSEAIVLKKDDAQVFLDRANAYSRLLDFDRAVSDVNMALKLGGDDAFILIANKLKGRFLTRQGKTNEAVVHWKALAKKNPKDQELIEDVIDILMADNLYLSALELAIQLRDNTKDPYKKALRTLRVGGVLSKQGERDKALKTYVDSLELSGNGSWLEREILGLIQTVFKREDNLNGLVKTLSQLIKKYPQRVQIEMQLVGVLVEQRKFSAAKKIYRSLIKKLPMDDSLRLSYFSMLKKSEDFKAARSLMDELIKLKPEDAKLHLERAELSYEMKIKNDVLNDLANYKKVAKPNELTEVNYAVQLSRYDFKQEALAAYKLAVRAYPESLSTAIAAAQYLYTNDDEDQAVKIWGDMAEKVDRDGLIRLLDALLINAQKKLAVDLVKSNYDKYKTNLLFLNAGIRAAEIFKENDLAVKFALRQLLVAKKTVEIDQAISVSARMIIKTDQVDIKIQEFSSKQNLSNTEKFLLADLLRYVGEQKKSDRLLSELAKTKEPINFLQLARIHERVDELDKAAANMEELIKLPKQLKATYLRKLSDIYRRLGKTNLALNTIQRWKTLSPNDKQVWLTEANLLAFEYGVEKALETLRKGAQKFEGDVEILSKLAKLNSASGKFYQARLLLWKLFDESKNMNERVRWAGELAKNAKDKESIDRLVDKLTRWRRNAPNSIAPIMALIEVYQVNGQEEEKKNILLEAIRLRPKDTSLLVKLASINRGTVAIEILRKAVKLDKSGSGLVARKLASLLMNRGETAEALKLLEDIAHESNVNIDARFVEDFVIKLLKQWKIDDAEVYLRGYLVKFPDDWRLLLLQCIIFYEQGYIKKAAEVALMSFSKNNKLKGLIKGWTPYSYDMLASILKSKPISQNHLNLLQFKVAVNMISYRKNSGLLAYVPSVSKLPKNLNSMRLLAASFFFQAFDELTEIDKKTLLLKARKVKMYKPELMYELYQLVMSRKKVDSNGRRVISYPLFLLKKIKEEPNNKLYYDLLVIKSIEDNTYVLPKKILMKARKFNLGENNSFVSMCLPLLTADELGEKERLDYTLERILKRNQVEDIDIMILFRQYSALTMLSSARRPLKIDPRLIEIFERYKDSAEARSSELINLKQNNLKQKQSEILTKVKNYLRLLLLQGDDYKKIIVCIEKFKKKESYYRYSSWSQSLLSFLSTVSRTQIAYFSNVKSSKRLSKLVLNPKKLARNLEVFKNPILKILATKYALPNIDVIPMIEEAKKDVRTRADAYLLHALSLKSNKKSGLSILKQLKLASKHSVVKQQRIQINHQILLDSLKMKKSKFEKLDKVLQEEIRVIARRMMITNKITRTRKIKKIMAHFSMEKEKAKFLPNNKRHVTSRTPFVRRRKTGRVKKSIRTKDMSEYIILKLRRLFKNQDYNLRQIDNILRQIERLKLRDVLLRKMNPKDSTSPRKWLEYLYLGKLLQDNEAYMGAANYLAELPVLPKNARLPIALAISKTQKKKAIKVLNGLSRNSDSIVWSLYKNLVINRKKPEMYLYDLEFINDYIASLSKNKSGETLSFHYLRDLIKQCLDIKQADKESISPYYQVIPKINKELIMRRDKACREYMLYALYAMPSKQIAKKAFKIFLKYFSEGEKYSDTNIFIAKKSLLGLTKMKANPYGPINFNFRGLIKSNEYNAEPDQSEYLVEAIFAKKSSALLDDHFLKKIRSRDEKIYRKLKDYKDYLLASGAEIAKKMNELEKSNNYDDYLFWLEIIRKRSDGFLETEFAKHYFNYLRRSKMDLNLFRRGTAVQDLTEIIEFLINSLYRNNKQKVIFNYINFQVPELFKNSNGQEFSVWLAMIMNARVAPKTIQHLTAVLVMKQLLSNPISLADGIKFTVKYKYPLGLENYFGFSGYRFPDQLYESLLRTGYLNNPETMTLIKLPVTVEQYLKNQKNDEIKGKVMTFIRKQGNKMKILYDIEYLAQIYKNIVFYDENPARMQMLKTKFKSAPKESQYGVSLFLALLGEQTFDKFIKAHAETLKKAPKSHLRALRLMFDINYLPKRKALFKFYKLESLLTNTI